jgi:hypothetical protein
MQDWSSRSQFCFSRLAARSMPGAYSISRRSDGHAASARRSQETRQARAISLLAKPAVCRCPYRDLRPEKAIITLLRWPRLRRTCTNHHLG